MMTILHMMMVILNIFSSCGLYLCQQCLPMTRSLHSIECNLLSQVAAHTMAQDRRVNTLVSVARLLLCHGWDHLEGNVDARVGCDAWEDIETGVIPLLCKAKGKDGSLLFSKVCCDDCLLLV